MKIQEKIFKHKKAACCVALGLNLENGPNASIDSWVVLEHEENYMVYLRSDWLLGIGVDKNKWKVLSINEGWSAVYFSK